MALLGHVQLDMTGAQCIEAFFHDRAGELRFIAFAAEMTQEEVTQFGGHELRGGLRRRGIREMTVATQNALLKAPGAMRTVLQHFHIVIGFEQQNVRAANAFDHEAGCMTQISKEADFTSGGMQEKGDGILGVMRDRERFDEHISEFKAAAGAEQAAIESCPRLSLQRFTGIAIAINRDPQFLREQQQSLDMVGMLMGYQDPGQILRRPPDSSQALPNLTAAKSCVDQDPGFVSLDIRTVSS